MRIGTWSEPVEGREASHRLTNGRSRALAKARLMTEGHACPEKGNLVHTPGELRTAKPPSTANSNHCELKARGGGANLLRGERAK